MPTTIVASKPLSSGPIAHAIEVAQGIRSTGIGCANAEIDLGPNGAFSGADPSTGPTEQVSCNIGDDMVAISLWPDHAALTRGEPSVRQDMCYVAADQHTNLTYVLGDNWIIFPERATTARRLGPLLRAAVTTIRC